MDNENALVQVTPDDLAFLEQELSKTSKPAPIRELAEKLAFRKTADQRIQDVKLYDPACVYQIGDSIYKEYDEPLTVSSKTVEPFKGAVDALRDRRNCGPHFLEDGYDNPFLLLEERHEKMERSRFGMISFERKLLGRGKSLLRFYGKFLKTYHAAPPFAASLPGYTRTPRARAAQ